LRLEVPHEHLGRYIKLIQEYVPLGPIELLFNRDESGFSDLEEYKPKGVLIPIERQATALHYPTPRKIRRQTRMCDVTAVEDACSPTLVSAQPVVREVSQHQIRNGINLQTEIAHSPYVTSEIFERYIDSVLIPAVGANRELPGCTKKPAILFCDNCSADMSAPVLQKLAHHRVPVITYPTDTSHIFQVLDVLLLGLLKRSKKFQMRDNGLDAHMDHILRLFRAYETVTASTTTSVAGRKAGFEYGNRSTTTHLRVNKRQIRESPDFREVWMFDYHESWLSARRQKEEWGWINEKMLHCVQSGF
jgi:hypothetical protein